MADKYTFSVEDSLLDALGFIKKIATTVIDMIIRPWRLVINSYEVIEYKKQVCAYNPSKNPGNKYVSHFLYFVMVSLTFLSYFKAFIFNQHNGINESSYDVMRETNAYLANTSIVEKLLLYFLVILVMYIVISVLAYLMGCFFCKYLKLSQKDAVYLFKRMSYYLIGTAILLQLVPVLFRNMMPPGKENLLGNILRWGYWGYCIAFLGFAIQDKADSAPKAYFSFKYFTGTLLQSIFKGFYYILFIILVGIAADSFIYKTGFQWWLGKTGYLDFTPKIKIEDYASGSDVISMAKVNSNDSTSWILQADILLVNEWKDVILKHNPCISIYFVKQGPLGNDTTAIRFQALPQQVDSVHVDLPLLANAVQRIHLASEPISKHTIAALEKDISDNNSKLKIKYVLNYVPANRYEREANHYIKVVFR